MPPFFLSATKSELLQTGRVIGNGLHFLIGHFVGDGTHHLAGIVAAFARAESF